MGASASPLLPSPGRVDGDVVLLGEIVVSLVVGGHGHDGPSSVGGDDEIANPDWNMLTGQRMDGVASENTPFFLFMFLMRSNSAIEATSS